MAARHVLLKIGLIDLNATRMQRLIEESNDEMIKWAYNNGKYDVRLQAVQYFANHNKETATSILKKAMDDPTEIISQTAMSALEQLPYSSEVALMIKMKRQFWVDENEYREGRRNRSHHKVTVRESKERGSKKTLNTVRSMLKKPINGGKWF